MDKQAAPPQYAMNAPMAGSAYIVPPQMPQQTVIVAQPSGAINPVYVTSTDNLQTTSVVVINQPTAEKPVPLAGTGRDWNHSLISDCCDDPCVAALGYCCPVGMMCCIFNSMDECTYCVYVLGGVFAAMIARAKMRTALKIRGSICGDVLCSVCCIHCVACQMYKELKDVGQLKKSCCYCGCDSEKQCLCK